jgi:hypothetical protein
MSSRSNSPNGVDAVNAQSKSKRNYGLGPNFTDEERLWWWELCYCKAVEIVTANPSATAETWNSLFKTSMTMLKADHASTCRYSPSLYTHRRHAKSRQAGALRKMPADLMWLIIADWLKSRKTPSSKGTHINLRERFRDEFLAGLTEGVLYGIIQSMQEKDLDIKHEDYGTVKDSNTKHRRQNAVNYHTNQELIFVRQHFFGPGAEVTSPPKAQCGLGIFDDDSDGDCKLASDLSVAVDMIKEECKAMICGKETVSLEAGFSPTLLQAYQQSVDYGSAKKHTIVDMFGVAVKHYCYGHKMPPYTAEAEGNQCLALCISHVTGTQVQEVRAQMKACSIAFCSEANKDFKNLHKFQRTACELMGQTSQTVDIDAFRHYSLPCVSGRDFVVVTYNKDDNFTEDEETSDDCMFTIDIYSTIPGAISDDAALLFLFKGHFTVMRIPERTFVSVKNFVDVMTIINSVPCTFTTIKTAPPPGTTNNQGLSTPTPVKQEKAEQTPSPPNKDDSYGFPCGSSNPKSSRSPSGNGTNSEPLSLVSSEEEEGSGDDSTPAIRLSCEKLFARTGRGSVKKRLLLDDSGPAKYNDKVSYMHGHSVWPDAPVESRRPQGGPLKGCECQGQGS